MFEGDGGRLHHGSNSSFEHLLKPHYASLNGFIRESPASLQMCFSKALMVFRTSVHGPFNIDNCDTEKLLYLFISTVTFVLLRGELEPLLLYCL